MPGESEFLNMEDYMGAYKNTSMCIINMHLENLNDQMYFYGFHVPMLLLFLLLLLF